MSRLLLIVLGKPCKLGRRNNSKNVFLRMDLCSEDLIEKCKRAAVSHQQMSIEARESSTAKQRRFCS